MQSWFEKLVVLVLFSCLVSACNADPPPAVDAATVDAGPDAGPPCVGDDDCDDGLFCTGRERCDRAAAGADARGCVMARAVPCLEDQLCSEATDVCETDCPVNPDADDDGADAIDCGGDDCDDSDPQRFPGNAEICDPGHDEDCDGATFGLWDRDRDGWNDARCVNVIDSVRTSGDDCDDLRGSTAPMMDEACNGLDDDCDGLVDEGAQIAGFLDTDGDLHGDPLAPTMACLGGGRFAVLGDDCDDTSPVRHPAQVEICDGVDNDCDTRVDESTVPVPWYPDGDDDGYGRATDASAVRVSCEPIDGYSILASDCDDASATSRPGGLEACNGVDDDCNGRLDYVIGPNDSEDDDRDGFLDVGCGAFGDDCDDAQATVHAGASELCDFRDNDCDLAVDEMAIDGVWYIDRDGDGAGEIGGESVSSCEPQPGRVLVAGDCDDSRADRRPGLFDACDGQDEDCDGETDEDAARAYFQDEDGDGAGGATAVIACTAPDGYVVAPGDCNDADASEGPGGSELCNGSDDDCDGTVDEGAAASCGAGSSASCVSGSCVIDMCVSPFLDCDTLAGTGCEVDPRTDALHCGSCTACPDRPASSPTCVDSVCGVSCEVGLGDCDGDLTNGCEMSVASDPLNCGGCARRCSPREHAVPACVASTCTIRCDAGFLDCDGNVSNGCETWIDGDGANCGSCGRVCPATEICGLGDCFESPFDPTLATTELVVATDMVLAAGPHYYTRIHVMAGATLRTDGDGVLELFSTGEVLIEGTIDLSGGDGGIPICMTSGVGGNGGGGGTGTAVDGLPGMFGGVCRLGGTGGTGGVGTDGSLTPCATGGVRGGGAGGIQSGSLGWSGGGGGGVAGGGGASGAHGTSGGNGGSSPGRGVGGTGSIGSLVALGGDTMLAPPYDGADASGAAYGAGGGSIGFAAVADLDVSDTFWPGSGGGGGGSAATCGGSGGGGGGGALRIVSLTRIEIVGAVRADGGESNALASPGIGGGGGSGGVIVISSPELEIGGVVSAIGGRAFGSAPLGSSGGRGGLGRIRISTIPGRCDVSAATVSPALVSGCAETPGPGTPGRSYVGIWPL